MGMFDSVWVKCPKCNTENEFQSKSGDCSLEHYTLENCPKDVLANVNRHAPIHCECGSAYSVDIFLKKPFLVNIPNQPTKLKTKTMKLYKIENRIGTYWVVAEHPTEAENKLLDILNKENYGIRDDRKTITITVIAEQITDQFLTGKHLVL